MLTIAGGIVLGGLALVFLLKTRAGYHVLVFFFGAGLVLILAAIGLIVPIMLRVPGGDWLLWYVGLSLILAFVAGIVSAIRN